MVQCQTLRLSRVGPKTRIHSCQGHVRRYPLPELKRFQWNDFSDRQIGTVPQDYTLTCGQIPIYKPPFPALWREMGGC